MNGSTDSLQDSSELHDFFADLQEWTCRLSGVTRLQSKIFTENLTDAEELSADLPWVKFLQLVQQPAWWDLVLQLLQQPVWRFLGLSNQWHAGSKE